MVRAQVTAWSERRSQGGAAVVIIGVPPPVRAVLRCGGLQYSGPHRHRVLCAANLALRWSRCRLLGAKMSPGWRTSRSVSGLRKPRNGVHGSDVAHRRGGRHQLDRPGLIVDCVDRRWLGAIVVGAASSLRIVSARARRCRHPAPAANAGQRHRMSPASTYTCRISRVSSRHPSTELLPPRSDEYRFWASRRAGPTARTGITPATIRPASHSRLRVKVNTRSPPCCRSVQQNT